MRRSQTLADQFRGALLGVAVGDALGAPFEGSAHVSPKQLRTHLESGEPLRYTDDTHMTLGLADALIAAGELDSSVLAERWMTNYLSEPWRGYGPGPVKVFSLIRAGVPWDEASRHLHGGAGSWGDGAAMRVAPVALVALDDLERVAWLARQSAMVTHTHPLGIEGAVLQAIAIALLLQSEPGSFLDVPRFLETIRSYVGAVEYCQQLDSLPELLPGGRWTPGEALSVLGRGVAAHESVPTALYAFLLHRDDFAAVIAFTIGLGGDTDTIAALAGALAGAHLGEEAIPARWRAAVEGTARLREQADALLALRQRKFSPPASATI